MPSSHPKISQALVLSKPSWILWPWFWVPTVFDRMLKDQHPYSCLWASSLLENDGGGGVDSKKHCALMLSCQDPHLIAEILSDPRLIPYCSPNSVPTILWDPDTMLTIPLNSDWRPPMHYHCSLRPPNDLWDPPPHFCLHYSGLVSLHSNLISHPCLSFHPSFLIYCTISVLLFSCSSLCSTIVH